MKVIALQRHTKQIEPFNIVVEKKSELQAKIREIFATTHYDVIVAKANNKIYSMELVNNITKTGGRVTDPNLVDYVTAKLNYHPLSNKL